jgi:hypothetical protein
MEEKSEIQNRVLSFQENTKTATEKDRVPPGKIPW